MIWACTARAEENDRWARTCSPEWSTAVDLRHKCPWAILCDTTSRLRPHHNLWSRLRCLRSRLHPRPRPFRQTQKAKARIWISCLAWRPPTSTSTAASFSPSPSPASSWCIGSSTAIWVMTLSPIWSSWVKTKKNLRKFYWKKWFGKKWLQRIHEVFIQFVGKNCNLNMEERSLIIF